VPWTKPEDLSFPSGDLLSKLGGQFKDGFLAVTADGFPRLMKTSIDPRFLKDYVVALVMWQLPAFFRGSQAVASADTT
jgi:hypothetical protein